MSTSSTPDFGSTVLNGWRQFSCDNWQAYIQHEFVVRLGDGSLPGSAFLAYLIQDYIFLVHFSRAWALAVVKADSMTQMRTAAATVNALINEEISLHIDLCAREGISETQLLEATEAPENIAYTRFVMDAGLSGDLLDLLAALTPCVFGYHEIGQYLADSHDTSPLYREWIDTYASEEYASVCLDVANLVEEVAATRLGNRPEDSPRWHTLCKLFNTATRLEIDFWQMGLRLGAN